MKERKSIDLERIYEATMRKEPRRSKGSERDKKTKKEAHFNLRFVKESEKLVCQNQNAPLPKIPLAYSVL